jgi:hypothetical protein
MNEQTYLAVEGVLYAYACGDSTARQVHVELAALGFDADLRRNPSSHVVEVYSLDTGTFYDVEV